MDGFLGALLASVVTVVGFYIAYRLGVRQERESLRRQAEFTAGAGLSRALRLAIRELDRPVEGMTEESVRLVRAQLDDAVSVELPAVHDPLVRLVASEGIYALQQLRVYIGVHDRDGWQIDPGDDRESLLRASNSQVRDVLRDYVQCIDTWRSGERIVAMPGTVGTSTVANSLVRLRFDLDGGGRAWKTAWEAHHRQPWWRRKRVPTP